MVVRVPNSALLSLENVLLNTEVAEWLLRVGGVAYHNEVFVLWAMYQLHTCQYCPECDWCPFFRTSIASVLRCDIHLRMHPCPFTAYFVRFLLCALPCRVTAVYSCATALFSS